MTYQEIKWKKENLKKEELRIYANYKEDSRDVIAKRKAVGKEWAKNIMSKI